MGIIKEDVIAVSGFKDTNEAGTIYRGDVLTRTGSGSTARGKMYGVLKAKATPSKDGFPLVIGVSMTEYDSTGQDASFPFGRDDIGILQLGIGDLIWDGYGTKPVANDPIMVSSHASGDNGEVTKYESLQLYNVKTGTVSVTAGTDAVLGVGTLFTMELQVGDKIIIGTQVCTVKTITDALNIVLGAVHVAGAAGAAYYFCNEEPKRIIGYCNEVPAATNYADTKALRTFKARINVL